MNRVFVSFLLLFLSGCVFLPQSPNYAGPTERPAALEQYYARDPYGDFQEFTLQAADDVTIKRIVLQSTKGEIVIDYFQHKEKTDDLVLVFPLLGGKNLIPDYFAAYFAKRGFDAAIIHRNDDFKDPEKFEEIETMLRDCVIRDRIAMDFFEKEYGKTKFGGFGISRGAINAAITASIDPRLKYNVLAMGGSDLVTMFKKAKIKRLKDYRKAVMERLGITDDEFFARLRAKVKTDPMYLAKHLDANNTLMFLSMFDKTVPIKNGMELREEIGEPRTIYIAAGHFTSILYTQMVKVFPPTPEAIFPFTYIESESLEFFNKRMRGEGDDLTLLPFRILQVPMGIIQRVVEPFL